jgi:hypothetical protein
MFFVLFFISLKNTQIILESILKSKNVPIAYADVIKTMSEATENLSHGLYEAL